MMITYKEKLEKFLDEFCDVFFLTKKELITARTSSILIEYRNLFFYCCKEKFPIVSSRSIGKILNKSSVTVNIGIKQISFLVKRRNKQILKKLNAVNNIKIMSD